MDKNEVKKFLLKNRDLMAKFSHYVSGNLYYTVQLEDGTYQFPIATVEEDDTHVNEDKGIGSSLVLSSDLGTTAFDTEIKASFLNRWVDKAISNGTFIKI